MSTSKTILLFLSLFVFFMENVFCTVNFEGIDQRVAETLETFNVPGLAIGIVENNEVLFSKGYGYRNVRKKLPVTEHTLFPIASCTKAFTTFILGQLVEEGRLSWDDPVITYIPELRLFNDALTREVTIRDLVAHRTGIPGHEMIWLYNNISREDILGFFQYFEPRYQLRENFLYNNYLYAVSGLVIERITGKTWEKVVNSRVFLPLGMTNSNICTDKLTRNGDYALPYGEIQGVLENLNFRNLDSVAPGAAINSSAIDMLKWLENHLSNGNSLVQPNTLDEMHRSHIFFKSGDFEAIGFVPVGYGLGWFEMLYQGHKIISHQGAIEGFSCEMLLIPEKNMGLIFLTNSSTNGKYAIPVIKNTLLDRIFEHKETNWMEQVKMKKEKDKEKNNHILEAIPLTKSLEEFVGCFTHPAYGLVKILVHNEQLMAKYGNLMLTLTYVQPDIFRTIASIAPFNFKRIVDFDFKNENQIAVSFESNAKPLIFTKIDDSSEMDDLLSQ